METKTTHDFTKPSPQIREQHLCPECNEDMIITEQQRENGFLFIWYECAKDGCDGQWLKKNSDYDKCHKAINAELSD